jgi:hypothetical protein
MLHLQALNLARGGQIPFELLDAVAMSEEEAAALQTDANVERLIAETLAEAKRGLR